MKKLLAVILTLVLLASAMPALAATETEDASGTDADTETVEEAGTDGEAGPDEDEETDEEAESDEDEETDEEAESDEGEEEDEYSIIDLEIELTEEQEEALYEAGMAALDACVEEDMTDVEKLTALHDWLCLHCDYGATLRAATAYGAIVDGTAVCRGYANGLAYLATLAGLDGVSTYSEDMDHAWILATLDGDRYFCDCTWDDGKNAKMGLIRHTYWLFDEYNAWETGEHYGWDSEESVPGGYLEQAPWNTAMTRVVFQGDYCWYIDGDFCLWRCDRETWETEFLLDMDVVWPVLDQDGYHYTGLYSGLVLIDDRLIFNTPYAIYSCDLDGESLQILTVPDTSEALIYGIDVRDGNLCYSLAIEPDAIVYDVVDTGWSMEGAWGYGAQETETSEDASQDPDPQDGAD